MTGKADISGFTFKDSSKYRLYKSNGYWQSSIGDYGLHKCFGTLKNDTDNDVEFEVYCKYTSQDNEYFIMKFKRDRGFQDSGIGNAKIIETSKKYEYFLNSTSHSLKLGSFEYKFEILKRKVIKMILISFIKIF